MGTSKPTDAARLLTGPQNIESRDQLILRRRLAQRVWRAARVRAEQAALVLHQTPSGHAGPPDARTALEHALLAERTAHAAYQRVAGETGTLLGRLARIAADQRGGAVERTRAAAEGPAR
jgi:hypothetical protein